MAWRDEHGQPAAVLRGKKNIDRTVDELIGLCKGVAADGRTNQEEAEFLCGWLKANDHVRDTWPANVIRIRLCEYLEDGILDSDERTELFELMRQVTGKYCDTPALNFSSALPFDDPAPLLVFHTQRFCLTGQFAFGPRSSCEEMIASLGGTLTRFPAQKGCVLIVGVVGSRDWVHSTHGRKIEAAIELRSAGHPVHLVSEDHWTECMVKDLNLPK